MHTPVTLADFEYDYSSFDKEEVIGNEQYNPFRFVREHHNFRLSHIGNRISVMDNQIQLGFGSLLHLLDNVMYDTHSDIPRIHEHPLVRNEAYKKWIYHVRDFDKDGPMSIHMEDKYIYRTPGLMTNFMKFKSKERNNFRYLMDLEWIPKKKESLTLVNHNPLFRAYVHGRLKYYRKVVLILSSIVNTVLKIPEKRQYIHIPLTGAIYSKETFLRSKNKIDLTTIKYPESFHWIFMMHLLNFLDVKCNTSIFEAIPKDRLNDFNFILTVPGADGKWNAIFYNLQDLVDMNERNRCYVRLVNHINLLAASTVVPSGVLVEKLEADITHTDDPSKDVIAASIKVEDTEEGGSVAVVDSVPTVDKVIEEKIVETVKTIEATKELPPTVKPLVNTSPTKVITDTVKTITRNALPKAPVTPAVRQMSPVVAKAVPKSDNSTRMAAPKSSKVEVDTVDTTFVNEMDAKAVEFIESYPDITPKQKERCKILATKYKTLTIGDTPLEELLTKTDVSLDENDKAELVKDLPDKSMATSRIANFDQVYMKKSFKTDLASTIVAFNDKGMFVTDVVETPIVNELDNSKQYKVSYEDIQGKKHTVKFTIPIVAKDGTCKINGTKKYLKKQILTLPICKISPTRVSLASNYNKTIVERNEAKAHSFLPYMQRIVELGISNNELVCHYGMETLNLAISYEYTELAKKYKSLVLKTPDKQTCTLSFSYYDRYDVLVDPKDTDKVSALEKSYGVCVGSVNKLVYIFIDANNKLTYVRLNDKSVQADSPTSLIELFKKYYQSETASKINRLTEWTDLKILDKKFPIIFILSYMYGLRNTLAYLGVDYKITNKRSKTVLESSDMESKYSIKSKVNYLDSLDALELTSDEYVIVGSSAALAHGMPGVNEDIDISVSKATIDKLLSKKLIIPGAKDGIHDNNYTSLDGKIDLSYTALGDRLDTTVFDTYVKDSETVDGYRIVSYDALIKFYLLLYKTHGMEKHKVKLDWLKAHRVNNVEDYSLTDNDIVIKFKDCNLIFDRYPLAHSLIVAGLDFFDTSSYYLEEFDSKDVYYSLLVDKRYRVNYLKGIDAFFELFIDPITRDVLVQMNEPTNVRDLLIRATVLLTTTDHKEASSMANHRLRGYEQFNAILYNEMSRQYASYKVRRGKGNAFSINPEAVYQRIIKNESFAICEEINPYQSLKEASNVTYAGIGGRTSESFVVDDRRYPKDAIGIMSEATVDNGKVAINSCLTMDPSVLNTRGILDTRELSKVEPTNGLSAGALLMPCSTNDDSKRNSFITTQLSHVVPTKHADVNRVRTGFERLIAHRTSSSFCGVAKSDGVVSHIDVLAKMIRVDYKDGETDIFTFGEDFKEISGFLITQRMEILVKQGDKVKAGDIVCYNKDFFRVDPYSNQLDYVIGTNANVALMEGEGTQEDSNKLTRSFGAKLGMYPAAARVVELKSTDILHQMVSVGQHVTNTDILAIFEEGDSGDVFGTADEETKALLSKMNRKTPKAKYTGKISRIEAYYSAPLTEMHPSVKAAVVSASKEKNAKAKFVRGTEYEDNYNTVEMLPVGTKYKGITFEADTVAFVIYIQEEEDHGMGDKLVIANQLKSTTMGVMIDPPVTESGVEVDVLFSSNKIAGRVVTSPYTVGVSNRVLEELEFQVCDMYFDE